MEIRSSQRTAGRAQTAIDALEAFDEATRAIAGVKDLAPTLQLITDRVRVLVDAQYAALGIVNARGGIEQFITSGISDDVRRRIGDPPRGHGILGLIIRTERTYRIPDIGAHPDAHGFPPGHPPMRSFLGVPIHLQGGSFGNLYLTNKQGADEFTDADERLVEKFARHAAIAIENARLHERVQQLAIMEERERIGRDLHDGIIQSLYAVALSLEDVPELMADSPTEAAGRIDQAIDRLNGTIQEIRSFILGLSSGLAEATDLASGLARLVDETRLHTLVDLELDLADGGRVQAALSPSQQRHLLQIAREALSNLARHARATRGVVALREEAGVAVLEIVDNGRGFDPSAPLEPGHHGLDNLHDRTADMNGRLVVESAPGAGTRIIVRVPIEPAPEATS